LKLALRKEARRLGEEVFVPCLSIENRKKLEVRGKYFPGETPKNPPTARIFSRKILTKFPKRLMRWFRNRLNVREVIPVVNRSELSSDRL